LGNFTVKLSEEITIKVGAIILSVGCQAKFMREDYGFDLSRSVITHLQSGYHLEKLYGEAREKGIIFFKYEDSPEISFEHSLVNISVFDPLLKKRVGISSHLLVVEEEIMPMSEFKELGLDSKGLYQEENIWLYPAESNRRGIFFAGEDRYAAKVDKLSCQGCGICSSICPAGAIQLTQYENEQIITECASLLTD